MQRIVEIPADDWVEKLALAVLYSDWETTIIVHTEAQKEMAERAAQRMGKSITIRVKDATP